MMKIGRNSCEGATHLIQMTTGFVISWNYFDKHTHFLCKLTRQWLNYLPSIFKSTSTLKKYRIKWEILIQRGVSPLFDIFRFHRERSWGPCYDSQAAPTLHFSSGTESTLRYMWEKVPRANEGSGGGREGGRDEGRRREERRIALSILVHTPSLSHSPLVSDVHLC